MRKEAKILYVCGELMPYLPETRISALCRQLPQQIQERGGEIRTFMPKYGSINERRNQLHEVIRLSGMNIIIDDSDHQLIIKVASIPSARMQVYFIDNDDFFNRKFEVKDGEGNYFQDNDERAIFFARGVIETVSKLRWSPDIVHCHGWFSSIMPVYIKRLFSDNPLFSCSKIIVSLYNDSFDAPLNDNFDKKLSSEGVSVDELGLLQEPTYQNLIKFVLQYTDGIVFADKDIDPALKEYIIESGIKTLDASEDDENYADKYAEFYESVLE